MKGYDLTDSRAANGDAGDGLRLRHATVYNDMARSTTQFINDHDPDPNNDDATSTSEQGLLKKNVGLIGGISLIVGSMIGSGIFISPKGVTEGSGSVGLSLISWTICGLIAMLGSLCYAELGTFIKSSGGEYAYIKAGLHDVFAFLLAWMSIIFLKPAVIAIISLTCSEYVMVPFFEDGCGTPPELLKKLAAAAVILFLMAINCYSTKLANNIQIIFTVAKLLAIAIIIVGGIVKLAQGYTKNLATGFENTETNVGNIAIGFYNGMWAYDGWNSLNFVTEELKNPEKNLPLSILIGIPLVTVCYVLVNISYFTVMSVSELLASPAVALTWAELVIPSVKWMMPVFVAMSTFGASNGALFTSGRLCYVAAREGHMVEVLSMINVKKVTPLPSIVFTSIMAIVFVIPGDIGSLIDLFNFAVWLFYGLTMVALIVLRFTMKNEHRPFKVPIFIPIIVLIASLFLVVAPIAQSPKIEFLYAFLFIVGGLIFYVPFVLCKWHLPCMGAITAFFQMLTQSVVPKSEALIN